MLATGPGPARCGHPLSGRARREGHHRGARILGAPEGLKFVEENLDPSIKFKLVLCAVDEKLDERDIVPGLGDAGDRLYGVID